jgi:hypothetical protein
MDNKHPKSELPALKEAAAASKDKRGLQNSIAKEKKQHGRQPHAADTAKGPAAK